MLKMLTLNWNGRVKLEKLWASIKDWKTPFEWHVKDNGSNDESVAYLKSLDDSRVYAYGYKHNRDSFSVGVNYLYDNCSAKDGDLILLLNNDVMFKSDISSMINIMNKDSNVGVVGARLMYPGKDSIQHAGVVFSKVNSMPYHFKASRKLDPDSKLNREFQAVTGAVLLTRKEHFEKINGLNTKYQWAFEDISACLSIKYELNKKVVYCGQVGILHEESASLKINPIHKIFMNQNIEQFKKMWANKVALDDETYNKYPKHNIYK